MYCEDELDAALEIPDLRASEQQTEGPLWLLKDSDQIKPKYIRSQTKIQTYYKFRALVKQFISKYNKNIKILTSQAWDDWKNRTFNEQIDRNEFLFVEKFQNALNVFSMKKKKALRSKLLTWKLKLRDWKNRNKFEDQVKILKKELDLAMIEKDKIKKDLIEAEEKLKQVKLSRTEVGVFKGSSMEGLLKLRRENTLLSSKLAQTSAVFTSYMQQIQGLVQRY